MIDYRENFLKLLEEHGWKVYRNKVVPRAVQFPNLKVYNEQVTLYLHNNAVYLKYNPLGSFVNKYKQYSLFIDLKTINYHKLMEVIQDCKDAINEID